MPAALYSGLPILTLLLKHTKSWSITLWARVALMYDYSALTGPSGDQLCPLVLHPLNSAESPHSHADTICHSQVEIQFKFA